jgi:lipoteichoic acid synthase
MHEPFDFPQKERYLKKVDSVLNSPNKIKATKKQIESYKEIFASIVYADESIKKFMESYKKRPEYSNTIFFISGDHRLIPIVQKDKLCRFNVPFFIYSPMLNKTQKMKSVSSHFDFAPSLLAFLSKNYNVKLPKETAWLGTGIDTTKRFTNNHKIPLMRYKGSINDYLYKDYMLSDGVLYKINENFNTYKVNDEKMLDEITKSLREFKNLNAYVTNNDKIYPKNDDVLVAKRYEFSEKEKKTLDSLVAGITLDKAFNKARELAFNNQRVKARLICNYILSKEPNYIDVLLLKGRSLAWDGNYQASEEILLDALKRSPYYDDVYLALLDMYWWSSQNEKSNKIVELAIKNKIKNDNVAFKMARAYVTLNKNEKSIKVMDSILKRQPKNAAFIKFKSSLK